MPKGYHIHNTDCKCICCTNGNHKKGCKCVACLKRHGSYFHKKTCKCFSCKPKKDNKNPFWKGDKAGYFAIHGWLTRKLGQPRKCVQCRTKTSKRYHWANISGKYKRDIKDYKRLCQSCHMRFDSHLLKRGQENGNAKLTNSDVKKIKQIYIPFGSKSAKEVGKMFGVSESAILYIYKGATWKHI